MMDGLCSNIIDRVYMYSLSTITIVKVKVGVVVGMSRDCTKTTLQI